jgi:anti-sigma factor ChrR (cupin superfamily)
MTSASSKHEHAEPERLSLYALEALPSSEIPALEAHVSACEDCRNELDRLRTTVQSFVAWPTDVLRPPGSLQQRLAQRIAADTGGEPVMPPPRQWVEPEWEEVAPGISCKLLATDRACDRVSMLVRLAPGTDYPPHTHAGIEELHLLEGELMIDERKLYPGDYNRAEPGTSDSRVWSETGCTCVLVTSPSDVLR